MFLQHLKNVKSISITIVTIITTEAGAAVSKNNTKNQKCSLWQQYHQLFKNFTFKI
jgi:hypothetical protein